VKNTNTRKDTIPEKNQESNLSTNPKENRHTNIIPYLKTNIMG
jgi:protein tyrosine phosphatase